MSLEEVKTKLKKELQVDELNQYFQYEYSNGFVAGYCEGNDSIKIFESDDIEHPVLIIGDYECETEYQISLTCDNVRYDFIENIMNILKEVDEREG